MAGLTYVRVPSGGAGNKALMLLEGKDDVYIQDRGVSRWDTWAAQAVICVCGLNIMLYITYMCTCVTHHPVSTLLQHKQAQGRHYTNYIHILYTYTIG